VGEALRRAAREALRRAAREAPSWAAVREADEVVASAEALGARAAAPHGGR